MRYQVVGVRRRTVDERVPVRIVSGVAARPGQAHVLRTFDEPVGVLFEWSVVTDIAQVYVDAVLTGIVLRGTPRDRTRLHTRLDAAVIPQPLHAFVGDL